MAHLEADPTCLRCLERLVLDESDHALVVRMRQCFFHLGHHAWGRAEVIGRRSARLITAFLGMVYGWVAK